MALCAIRQASEKENTKGIAMQKLVKSKIGMSLLAAYALSRKEVLLKHQGRTEGLQEMNATYSFFLLCSLYTHMNCT